MSRSQRSRRRGHVPAEPAGEDGPLAATTQHLDRFEVRCTCGSVLRGQRTVDELQVNCPACGAEIALPAAGPAKPPSNTRPVSDPPRVAAPTGRAKRSSADTQPLAQGGKEAESAAAASPVELHPERAAQRRRLFALRLKALAVLILVAGTLYLAWHKRQRQYYLTELQTAASEGEAALADDDLPRALDKLARADRAARALHATDAQGRHATQLFREATIWSQLAVTDIADFFFTHERAAAESSVNLAAAFDRELAGRSAIIQCRAFPRSMLEDEAPLHPDHDVGANSHTTAEPKSPRSTMPAWACDWSVVGDGFRLELAGEDLRHLTAVLKPSESSGQEIIFGAELRSIERDPLRGGVWRLHVAPESCVLMTAEGPFNSINWPDRLALEQLLGEQRQRLHAAAAKEKP